MEEEKPWNIHTCDVCHYASKSVFVIRNHLDKHARLDVKPYWFHCKSSTPELYDCRLCDFQTDLEVTLFEHLRVTHGGKEVNDVLPIILEGYVCTNCCFTTYSLLVLLKHGCQDSDRHLSSMDVKVGEERPFKFERWNSQLKLLMLCKHTHPEDINWHECDKCSYKAKQNGLLALPEEIHWYKCEKCSYKAKWKSDLKKHSLKHTSSEKINWYECAHCSYKTKHKWHLKRHILCKHSCSEEINWHECDECPFKTKTKAGLKKHLIVRHASPEEIHWYQCDQCPYKCKSRSTLKRHFVNRHAPLEEIDWHECQQCFYVAKRKGDLKRHILLQHVRQGVRSGNRVPNTLQSPAAVQETERFTLVHEGQTAD